MTKRRKYRGVPACSLAKHRQSGKSTKSPKMRHHLKRMAEAQEVKAKPTTCTASTVEELMKQ
jgi:hypothetical protein